MSENMPDTDLQKAIDAGVPIIVVHFDPKTGEEISSEEYNMQNVSLSSWQIESLARTLLPSIQEFYSDPENVRKFEEWQAKRAKEDASQKALPSHKTTGKRKRKE